MARILFALPNHIGSCITSAPVALELKKRSHEVVVLSVESARPWFENIGLEFRNHHRIPNYRWTEPETSPWRLDQFHRWFTSSIPAQIADVSNLLEEEKFDFMVINPMLVGAGLAAEKACLPWASFVTWMLDEAVPAQQGLRSRWDRLRVLVGLEPDPRPDSEAAWFGFSSHLTILRGLPELLPNRPPLPSYAHRVGPITWDPPFVTDSAPWLENLGQERPAVLVVNSTAWNDDADIILKTAEGLAGEDLDVVATVVARHELGPLPPNLILAGFIPHGLLLPKISAVVCSGGLGITTRAVCQGIPVVIIPRLGESWRVAAAVVETGIGLALDPRTLTSENLRRVVISILTKDKYAAGARSLQRAALRYDAVVTSANLIEDNCS